MFWERSFWFAWIGLGLALGCDSAVDSGYSTLPIGIAFAPSQGSSQGREPVTLFGENLTQVIQVDFGGVAAEILHISDREIRVLSPVHPAGTVPISIKDQRGFQTEFPGAYRFEISRVQFRVFSEILLGSSAGLSNQTVAYGDFNGDSIPDIVVLREVWENNKRHQELQIALGKPWPKGLDYQFSRWASLNVYFGFRPSIQVADLNGDGFDDLLLFGDQQASDLLLLYNLGGQGFSQLTLGPHDLTMGRAFLEDLDQDGFLDLLVMGAQWLVYWGSPNSIELSPTLMASAFPTMGCSISSECDIDYARVDFEEHRSLVKAYHPTRHQLWVASVTRKRDIELLQYGHFNPNMRLLTLADVNGDGLSDLVFTNDQQDLSVELAVFDGQFLAPVLSHTDCVALRQNFLKDLARVRTGDINGDGLLDLFAFNINDDGCLLVGDGNGYFISTNIPGKRWAVDDVQLLDLNQDGTQDVLRHEHHYYISDLHRIRVLYGPALSFVPRLDFIPGSTFEPITSFPLAADFNGDGLVDLAGFTKQQDLFVALGHPFLGFQLGVEFHFKDPLGFPRVVAWDDFNQDQFKDLLVLEQSEFKEERIHLLFGIDQGFTASDQDFSGWGYLGHGVFQASEKRWFVVHDVFDTQKAFVLTYEAETQSFNPSHGFHIPKVDRPSTCMIFTDFNQDGLPDLLSGCKDNQVSIWFGILHDADGFQLHHTHETYPVASRHQTKPHILDVDGDGDLDFISVGFDDQFRVYLNDSLGDFSRMLSVKLKDRHTFQGMADVDGDNHPEFLVLGFDATLWAIPWKSPYRLEEPFFLHDLLKEASFGEYQISMAAVDDPFFLDHYKGGFFRHNDLTGDGLDDLLFLTLPDPWNEEWGGNLLLFENISW